jgi:hypothetical protein
MSGVVKGIKKVFKKIWNNKIVRAVVIAAAIYFTGGLAAGAMGSATAAALPGITAAAETLGVTAGAFGSTAAATAASGLTAGMTAAEITAATAGVAEGEAAGGMLAAAPEATGGGLLESAAVPAGGDALAGTEIANTYAAGANPVALSGNAAAGQSASWIPKWFSDLPAAAQTVVASAALEGAKGVAGAYMVNEQEKEVERLRAEHQANQEPVSLSWTGPSGFRGPQAPTGSQPTGATPAPAAEPGKSMPGAAVQPVAQEIGRAATGNMQTAKSRFAPDAPVDADEIERQRRLKTFQGGGLLQQGRRPV